MNGEVHVVVNPLGAPQWVVCLHVANYPLRALVLSIPGLTRFDLFGDKHAIAIDI